MKKPKDVLCPWCKKPMDLVDLETIPHFFYYTCFLPSCLAHGPMRRSARGAKQAIRRMLDVNLALLGG